MSTTQSLPWKSVAEREKMISQYLRDYRIKLAGEIVRIWESAARSVWSHFAKCDYNAESARKMEEYIQERLDTSLKGQYSEVLWVDRLATRPHVKLLEHGSVSIHPPGWIKGLMEDTSMDYATMRYDAAIETFYDKYDPLRKHVFRKQ